VLTWILVLVGAAWAAQRRYTSREAPLVDPDEQALAKRAALGDESAARELARRAEQAAAALRLRAQTDREAAHEYRDQVRRELSTLEAVARRLASMDLPDAQRSDVAAKIEAKLGHLRRELAWIEERRRTLS
jgi:hypothetical protein